jgi:hypothetical protein
LIYAGSQSPFSGKEFPLFRFTSLETIAGNASRKRGEEEENEFLRAKKDIEEKWMKGTRRWSDGFGNPQEEKPHLFPNLDFGETRETGRGRSRNERETKMIDQKPKFPVRFCERPPKPKCQRN